MICPHDLTCLLLFSLSFVQLQSAPKRLALHEAVTTPHWGSPAALRFSRSGGRFGAVGEGGLVGLWRQDFISAVDGLGHAEWVGHCLSRAGTALTFLGDTGSQVGGNLAQPGFGAAWLCSWMLDAVAVA
jgi:hypothetical protein